jgi:hypothetical protein
VFGAFVKQVAATRTGTSMLMKRDPEMEARWAEEKRDRQKELLFRLDRIELRYQTKEVHRIVVDVLRRSPSWPATDEWAPKEMQDAMILNRVYDLDHEIPRARESINAGDVWNNQNFSRVRDFDEDLSFWLACRRDRLRRSAATEATKKRKDKGVSHRKQVLAAVERIRAKSPALLYPRFCSEVVAELKREGLILSLDRVQFYYPRKQHPVGK